MHVILYILGNAAQEYGVSSAQFQTRGTKSFFKDGHSFGWQTITDMWAREVGRMKANKLTGVPKLKELSCTSFMMCGPG